MNEMVLQMLNDAKSLTIFLLALIIFVSSCSKGPTEEEYLRERGIDNCERILQIPTISEKYKSRAKVALQKWKNDKLDPEPILIRPGLVQPQDSNDIYLAIEASDEDNDIVGILVREKHVKSNEQVIFIEEEYPFFENQQVIPAGVHIIPVMIRKNNERKSEKHWKIFTDIGISHKDLLPFVWISIPVPGKIEVEVSVYDQKGHKSAPVFLENYLDQDDEPNKIRSLDTKDVK